MKRGGGHGGDLSDRRGTVIVAVFIRTGTCCAGLVPRGEAEDTAEKTTSGLGGQ